MRNKTSKSKPNDVGSSLTFLQKETLCGLAAQIQSTAITFHIEEKDESLQGGDKEQLSPRGVLEGPCSELDGSCPSGSSVDYSPRTSLRALLSRSSSGDDEKFVAKKHQRKCLTLWKNLASRYLQRCPAKRRLRDFSKSLSNRSIKGVSKTQRLDSMLAKACKCNGKKSSEANTSPNTKQSWRYFTSEEITYATNNFHPDNIVGKGGYAEVYRGTLENGQVIAVKKLNQDEAGGRMENEFLMEIGIMGHIHHSNIAPLIGFCLEDGLHLIFHFYSHGSLASLLYGAKYHILEWHIRYKVAVGTARGLYYLHNHCQHRIIHRDIKASNILLGPDFEPQISDFGLAKWLPNQWAHHSVIPIEGTFGYLAPEYFMHGIVDEKTDIFAFGVLLLEIISGRRPIDASQQSLVLWARPFLESGKIQELADPKLQGSFDTQEMQHMILAAAMCVQQSAILRPSMREVLELLTGRYTSDSFESWRLTLPKSQNMEDLSGCGYNQDDD